MYVFWSAPCSPGAMVSVIRGFATSDYLFQECWPFKNLSILNLSARHLEKYSRLSLSRLRLPRITAYLKERIWFFFKRRNLTSGNKILWITREIALKEQFLPFSTIFSVYILTKGIYSFVKFGCAICIFLNSENLICRSTDISKCFRGSLQLRD